MADTTKARKASKTLSTDGIARLTSHGPVDPATGKAPVTATREIDLSTFPLPMQALCACRGLLEFVADRYNTSGPNSPTPEAAFDTVTAAMLAGTFTFGRTVGEAEPSDLQLAIAEVRGIPVASIVEAFDTRMKTNPDGTIYKDTKGHAHRFFDKTMQAKLAADPRIKVVMARLASEAAKRLAAEAKAGGASSDDLLSSFGEQAPTPEPAQAAA